MASNEQMFSKADIDKLNVQLEKQGAKWRAAETPISKLTLDQFKKMMGWQKDKSVVEKKPGTNWTIKSYKWAPGDKYDAVVDWRNRNGKNYVTPVQNQGRCGSCVSFAVTGLIESMALIEKGITLSLSQSDMQFCGSHGADCGAWGDTSALADAKTRGVVSSNKFPYADAFPNDDITQSPPSCRVIANHNNYSVKITETENIFSVADRKSYISNVGPVVAGITTYADMSPYPGGIYTPATENNPGTGGHCILIIGYSDVEQYWLCKNSWGENWGENGYIRIAYGACDIDIETATEKTYYTTAEGVIIPDSVLDELVVNKGLSQLSNIGNILCADGFFSNDDNYRHAIIGTTGGQITEIFFNPQTGKGQTVLSTQNGLTDLGAFYTSDDQYRHVITADNQGNIFEIFYSPKTGKGNSPLGNIPGAIRVCGFFSSDDNYRHAIVASHDGRIFEIFYSPKTGKGQDELGTFQNVVDIASFYSPDDQFRHVIVATADGNITEIFFHPQKGKGQTVLANIPGVKKIAAFYTSGKDYYNRRVQVLGQDNTITEIRYNPVNGIVFNAVDNIAGVSDIGGFFSPDDNYSHSILGLQTGDIKELFYNP